MTSCDRSAMRHIRIISRSFECASRDFGHNMNLGKRNIFKRLILAAVVLALPVMCLVVMFNGGMNRMGKVQPVLVNGDLSFQIEYGRSGGLLYLMIIEHATDADVWDIKLAYFYGTTLGYGEIPQEFETDNGVANSAYQTFPKTGRPLALAEGKVYALHTAWQIDTWVGAGKGSQTEYFEIEGKKIVFVDNPSVK